MLLSIKLNITFNYW